MAMKIGCFALVDAFRTLDHQLDRIKEWGFRYADVTDTGDGATLGNHFGFSSVASLDDNPYDLQRLFASRGLEITSWCAHADLLDPTAPWRYGTAQIIKAVRAAAAIGLRHVITTDGDPTTPFGRGLSRQEAVFLILERLAEPLRLAEDTGVEILLETHGPYTGRLDTLREIVERANSPALAINLDTGNTWLAGLDPVDVVTAFGDRIRHVHWKDLDASWEAKRGKMFGTGMATIPVGNGVIDIKTVYDALVKAGFDGYTTLEVAGDEAVLGSARFLTALGAAI